METGLEKQEFYWHNIDWDEVELMAENGFLIEDAAKVVGIEHENDYFNFVKRCARRQIDFVRNPYKGKLDDLQHVQEWRSWVDYREKTIKPLLKRGKRKKAVDLYWQIGKDLRRVVSEEQLERFFFYLSKGVTVHRACRAAGFSPAWVTKEKALDPSFAQKIDEITSQAVANKFVELYNAADVENIEALKFYLKTNKEAASDLAKEDETVKNIAVSFNFNRYELASKVDERLLVDTTSSDVNQIAPGHIVEGEIIDEEGKEEKNVPQV